MKEEKHIKLFLVCLYSLFVVCFFREIKVMGWDRNDRIWVYDGGFMAFLITKMLCLMNRKLDSKGMAAETREQ